MNIVASRESKNMCSSITLKNIWWIFFGSFLVLTVIAVATYYGKKNCTELGPTISSSLFQEYWQGVTIIFFILGAFFFSKDEEKLLKLSLAIFAVAFIVPGYGNNGVHIVAVMAGTAGLWIAVIHKMWTNHEELVRDKRCCQMEGVCYWMSRIAIAISIVTGSIFFYVDIHVWGNQDCHWGGIMEYIAFSSLFLSTYVLVPHKQTFYLFKDPQDTRSTRSYEDMENTQVRVAAFFPTNRVVPADDDDDDE